MPRRGCSPGGTASRRNLRSISTWLVVAQRLDEIALAHLGAPLDADLGGALLQVLLGPVVVGAGLAALLRGRLAVGVGDPRRLLLALALPAQSLVLLGVFDA